MISGINSSNSLNNTKNVTNVKAKVEVPKKDADISVSNLNNKESNINVKKYDDSSFEANIKLDISSLKDEQFVSNSSSTIKGFLTGTLTDKEEGKIVSIIKDAKNNGSLNELINELSTSGSLDKVVGRWDEERNNYEEPGMIDSAISWIMGEDSSEPPKNVNFKTTLFKEIFNDKNLNKKAGRNTLSSFNNKKFNSSKDSNMGLQSLMMSVLSKNSVSNLSSDTIVLAKEIFTPRLGSSSFRDRVDSARRKLGM